MVNDTKAQSSSHFDSKTAFWVQFRN